MISFLVAGVLVVLVLGLCSVGAEADDWADRAEQTLSQQEVTHACPHETGG